MFLLLQPLDNHPWSQGANAVIEQCATLRCLREGVNVCSRGALDLLSDISLLDLWPCFSKAEYAVLTPEERNQLDKLVLEAICLKQPEILLIHCIKKVIYIPQIHRIKTKMPCRKRFHISDPTRLGFERLRARLQSLLTRHTPVTQFITILQIGLRGGICLRPSNVLVEGHSKSSSIDSFLTAASYGTST